jgi:hypothetical protein
MAFNVFNKVYVAPDYAYDAAFNRAIFSAHRNQADYVTYDALDSPGYNSEVLVSAESVNDIIGSEEGQYESIAHYLKSLFDSGVEARLYCDEASYMPLFFTWLKIAFPNINTDNAFTIYNLIKQREELVFPDNVDNRTFTSYRLQDKVNNITLSKADFVTKYNEFNTADTVTDAYYTEVRTAVKDSLCIESQLASYLSGNVTIDVISSKTKRILTKVLFAIIDDLRQYIRDNIMTTKVRNMTGITIGWDDQNWEAALRAQSSNMDFLFDTSLDSILESSDYRELNITTAIAWCQWVLDNTSEADAADVELYDLVAASQWIINNSNCFSSDETARNAAIANLIQLDIDFEGSTLIYQNEYLREKINTFWIEYIYQLKKANDTDTLILISHT